MPVELIIFTECHWNNSFCRSAGAYRIASELRLHGFTVQVVDFFGLMRSTDIDQLIAQYVGRETLAVCFSSTFFNVNHGGYFYGEGPVEARHIHERNDLIRQRELDGRFDEYPFSPEIMTEILNKFRQACPAIKVVYGGAKSKFGRAPGADVVFVDFAEETFLNYVQKLRLDRLMGLTTSSSRLIKYNKDADSFDFANAQIVWDKSDHLFRNELLPIEVTRGCIFKCKYCNFILTGRKKDEYVKSMTAIREELVRNHAEHGITRYLICDDTFNDSNQKLEDMLRVTDSLPFKLEFVAYIRPEILARYPQQLTTLRQLGLRFAKFGIETLNDATRKFILKGVEMERMVDTLQAIRDAWSDEVITSGSFIFGLPKETRESLQFQYEWIKTTGKDLLHRIDSHPLFINFGGDESIKKSDIDENYAQYGYVRGEGNNWTHPEMGISFVEMVQLVQKLTTELLADPRQVPGGFNGMMLSNVGTTVQDIQRFIRTGESLNYDSFYHTYAKRVNMYKERLLGPQVHQQV